MGGWRCLGLKTLPSSPPRVPVEDALQEVPEEGQQEEEDAFDDAPSVDAAAMATGFGGLRGSSSHSGSELNAAFGCSQIQAIAQQRQGLCRPGRHQAKGKAQRA
jgi:hypothetical protein